MRIKKGRPHRATLSLTQNAAIYLKPFGPAFNPLGKKIPFAGLTAVLPSVDTAPPPVTMFKKIAASLDAPDPEPEPKKAPAKKAD